MESMFHIRLICASILFGASLSVADSPDLAQHSALWEEIRTLQFVPARNAFETHTADDPSDREARLGEAIALLNVQPRTAANIQRVQRILEGLVVEDGSDFWGLGARFMLARMEQVHFEPPTPTAGVDQFLQLVADAPGTLWGELALLKAAPAMLYASISMEERQQRMDEIEEMAQNLTMDLIRRSLFITLADVALDFEMPADRALHYLLTADVEGMVRWQRRANAYLQIAGLARELGDLPLAREYYGRFYEEFKRDHRTYMVGRILEELAAEVSE